MTTTVIDTTVPDVTTSRPRPEPGPTPRPEGASDPTGGARPDPTEAAPVQPFELTWTISQIAEALQLSTKSVSRLVGLGLIPVPMKIGGSLRWYAPGFCAWLTTKGQEAQQARARQLQEAGGAGRASESGRQ